jgi:hypothetical protein
VLDGAELTMAPPPSDRLRSIKRLDQLVAYLRDELEWPVDSDDIADITYDYDPAEVGLDEEHAARIRDIKQLRPLASGQPWGIFWVSFEKKRLPVVVMRRILANLVLKSRAGAKGSDQRRWNLHDLLFISSFGEGDADQREIAFAHFHQESGDLPTLRVLGWDGGDTALQLEHVAHTLGTKLRWPQDPANIDQWRQQWSGAFRHRLGHVIRTSDMLAEVLAALAKRIRHAAERLIAAESERGPLTKLYRAFQAALLHDLTDEQFADTYAQTITYGLLTAAISRTEMSEGARGTVLVAENMTDMVPVTNPFLKEMLQTFLQAGGRRGGIDFDELGIQDVVDLLRGEETDLPAVIRNFGDRKPGDDPVIHFYEHFLSAYNKELKIQRGVFYTPQPVVSYIVRSVHELLQTEFGLADGLADTTTWGEMLTKHPGLKLPPLTDEPGEERTISPDELFVQILDPATGTATFLVEVIDIIHRTLSAKWKQQRLTEAQQLSAWNAYVPQYLLPRLHAFELMMAPYAIAHMKIGLKLAETGYRFGTEERARIYLTNALEPKVSQLPQIGFEALAHEAAAVNEIKWYKRFTVVIGNPPYAGYSANEGEWIEQLMEDYKKTVRGEERQIQRLSNDYVKFIRFSESLLSLSNLGCLGFITDSGYLNGILFRDMRAVLQSSFQRAWILDLHGVAMRGAERHIGVDENVFDITQGVAVALYARSDALPPSVHHADLLGSRHEKYSMLSKSSARSTPWAVLKPSPPKWFLVPSSSDDDYEAWPLFTDVIGTGSPKNDRDSRYGTGIKTRHDEFVVGYTPQDAVTRVKQVANRKESDAVLIQKLGLCTTAHFSIRDARRRAEASDLLKQVMPIAYRPFDWRSIVYLREFICEPKAETMRHMMHPQNLAMAVLRRDRKEKGAGFFVARGLIAKDLVSNLDDALVWPLFLIHDEEQLLGKQTGEPVGTPNIARSIVAHLTAGLGLEWCEHDGGHLTRSLRPEDVFYYAYAVFHSPGYRSRYAEFLKIDFPRLPLTGNLELFRALARLGGELTALHLLESPKLDKPITEFIGGRAPEIEKITWSKNTVWIDKAQTIGFRGVREEVWNFHIGGYQVCEKWLKDRKGRKLLKDDIDHYHKIVVALSETIRLMAEIDQVIAKHGGWPGAFKTDAAPDAPRPGTTHAKAPKSDLGLQTEDELPLG